MPTHTIHAGDCLDVLAQLEPRRVDAFRARCARDILAALEEAS